MRYKMLYLLGSWSKYTYIWRRIGPLQLLDVQNCQTKILTTPLFWGAYAKFSCIFSLQNASGDNIIGLLLSCYAMQMIQLKQILLHKRWQMLCRLCRQWQSNSHVSINRVIHVSAKSFIDSSRPINLNTGFFPYGVVYRSPFSHIIPAGLEAAPTGSRDASTEIDRTFGVNWRPGMRCVFNSSAAFVYVVIAFLCSTFNVLWPASQDKSRLLND